MNFQIEGTVKRISKVVQKTPTFRVKALLLEYTESYNEKVYTTPLKFEFQNKNIEKLDGVNIGDEIKVSFNIRGFQTDEGKVYNSLTGWKIENMEEEEQSVQPQDLIGDEAVAVEADDDLPF